MPKQRITTAINKVLNEQFGFEIYIVMKDGEQLVKRFVLDEGNPNETDGFKRRLRESIKEAIQNSFLADDSKYANGDDLANEQTCFYVIKQDDAYQPFSYLSVPESHIENFKLSDKDNAADGGRSITQCLRSLRDPEITQKIHLRNEPQAAEITL